jgi:SAM-dependent methyltransferase
MIEMPTLCKKYMDLQCNGDDSLYTDFPENKNLEGYLKGTQPKKAIDIGSGIGRASVWFKQHYGWNDTEFYLMDGDSGEKQLDGLRKGTDDFYNSLECTKLFCESNRLKYTLVNAENKEWEKALPEDFDIAYSFLAFGFHWPIDQVLTKIYSILKPGGLAIFGLRGIEKVKWVQQQIYDIPGECFQTIEFVIKPKATKESVLILRKL